MPGTSHASIWTLPEGGDRTVPGPRRAHSRRRITEAAIRVADAEGLEAASMRRIAAELGAGAMTLYHYVPSRDDLIELMVDAVTGEMELPEDPARDWSASLSLMAQQKRSLWLRHPWLATRTPGHPIWGPNSLRVQEFGLAALGGFGLDVDELVSLVGLVNGYVESFTRAEVGWQQEARRTNVDMREWIRRMTPYAREIVASGKYPMFGRVLRETTTPHLAPDAQFGYGLARVLEAIAATLARIAPAVADGPVPRGD